MELLPRLTFKRRQWIWEQSINDYNIIVLCSIKYNDYKLSSECRSQAHPRMCSSASLCTQAELQTGCKSLGWRRLCPALYPPHQANPISEDVVSWVLMSHCPLGVFPLCWKCLHHADLVLSSALSKMQLEQDRPPQADLFSPTETSNPFSPSSLIQRNLSMYIFSQAKRKHAT